MKRFALIFCLSSIMMNLLHPQGNLRFKNESEYVLYFAGRMGIKEIEYLIETTNPKYNRHADMITDEYAIETDYHYKSYEAVGQALYYALMTGKKPGMVIILEMTPAEPGKKREVDEKSLSDLTEILKVAEKYQITVWTIDEEGNIEEKCKY